ncbi:MAG: formate/nitrite transporter family protein [Halanaerobiales bacterium]|nr:formate/nitrite transporter family protein [Halanaerobiales bacterium]
MGYYIPSEIAQLTVNSGVKKANQKLNALLISSFLAGAYIAIAGVASTMASHDTSQYLGLGVAKFLFASIFSVGLILVLICGSSLFTGNTLISMAYLDGKTTLNKMFRNWGIVFIGNFVGAIFVVYIMYKTNLWEGNNHLVGASMLKIANGKVNLTFSEAFFRGIMCNWLVCLAVWAMTAAKDIAGKVSVCYFIIMAFVVSGFEHVVANMYFIPMGLFIKGNSLVVETAGLEGALSSLNGMNMLVKNFVPVALGNIVGGAIFVGGIYWVLYQRKSKKEVMEIRTDVNQAAK